MKINSFSTAAHQTAACFVSSPPSKRYAWAHDYDHRQPLNTSRFDHAPMQQVAEARQDIGSSSRGGRPHHHHPYPNRSAREFPESSFRMEKLLGEGHFGKIYRAILVLPAHDPQRAPHHHHHYHHRDERTQHTTANMGQSRRDLAPGISNNIYAIKRFSKMRLLRSSQKKSNRMVELLKREVGIHKALDHPHVLNFFGHIHGETHLGLVLEYAPFGDLFGYMGHLRSSLDKLMITRHVMRQICSAVDYLKSRCVSHRDIKPENILVMDVATPTFKLCDFGWAVKYSKLRPQTTLCGTPEYVPVEMLTEINGRRVYDAEYVDVWALGVLFYELLHSVTPFYVEESEDAPRDSATRTELIYEEIRCFQSVRFLQMDCVSVECFQLMDSLLQIDPLMRCSAAEAAKHPFLSHGYM